ncbi:hypothetical protein C1I98_06070 [Spongiactinospora gelatinilytica]|uniref:Uncharacterized protein n=1 Tax=Spongiactinospora gelatinilytica TaxID=2666298 RepID=A0A2W2GXG1_9ACTN|nr:hypothetical protein [Spongiactinospora gelatinilytica]PZG53121.1 hypothetical protein C1I98_06070 [Spongiactinospora gelatinilytica]
MDDNSVDLGRVLTRVTNQRNTALDEAAAAMAKIEELREENAGLRAEVERLKRGDTAPTVVSGSVES